MHSGLSTERFLFHNDFTWELYQKKSEMTGTTGELSVHILPLHPLNHLQSVPTSFVFPNPQVLTCSAFSSWTSAILYSTTMLLQRQRCRVPWLSSMLPNTPSGYNLTSIALTLRLGSAPLHSTTVLIVHVTLIGKTAVGLCT